MSNMEEKLWDYIDSNCNEHDKITVSALIESNEEWRNTYNSLLALQDEILAVTPEQPPMAFCYNVMETIRNEQAAKPLKTKVNKYIIAAIAAILLLSLGWLTVLGVNDFNQSIGNYALDINILPFDLRSLIGSTAMKAFVYFDIMLVLFFADRLIRRKNKETATKSV